MQQKETTGTVVSVAKQWWLKVNTKAFRSGPSDGAVFPHIIKVSYTVDGTEYFKRKWLGAGNPVPGVGTDVKVIFDEAKPSQAKIVC